MLRWHGARGLTIETRSGNTAKPDTTWAPWRKLEQPQVTADNGAGQIASPAGRYVQYRVTLAGGRLRDVSVYLLPHNQRARITEITVAENPATTGAARVHSNLTRLRWKLENPDGDELTYRLAFREETESVWRALGGHDPLTKPEYDWNTEGLPDGNYVVRVTASDEKANPRERALDFTLDSPPLLIDNRKPEVLQLQASYPQVSGRARDAASIITDIEYAVDGGDWKNVAPSDGIFDDLTEAFSFRLPALAPGPHAVTVRAWDSGDNVGAAGVTVVVK
jgi:hypothetical protein